MSKLKFFRLEESNKKEISEELNKFKKMFNYNIGKYSVTIENDKNYFYFYERVGELDFFGYKDENNKIIMTGSALIKKINGKEVVYLSDLKLHPNFVGKRLAINLLNRFYDEYSKKYNHIYALSYNNPGEKMNRIVKILTLFKRGYFSENGSINLYVISSKKLEELSEIIEKNKNGYLKKIKANGKNFFNTKNQKIPLTFLEIGENKDESDVMKEEEDDKQIYSFSTLENSKLSKILSELNIKPKSSMTIVQHGMDDFDFEFINTSEI